MIMKPGEIVVSYKQAKYPENQIKILAQLNNCKQDDIKEMLTDAGVFKQR